MSHLLGNVVKDIGITNEIRCDNDLEQVKKNTEFMRKARNYNIHVYTTELYSPCHNKAEKHIQIIKGRSHRHAARNQVLKLPWGFVLVWKQIYNIALTT